MFKSGTTLSTFVVDEVTEIFYSKIFVGGSKYIDSEALILGDSMI